MAMQKRPIFWDSKGNILRSIIDLPLGDYLCIISVCRSSLPVSPSPSSDYSIGIGMQRGGTYSS